MINPKGWSEDIVQHFVNLMPPGAHVVYSNIPFMVVWEIISGTIITCGTITGPAVGVAPLRVVAGNLEIGFIEQGRESEGDTNVKVPGQYSLDFQKRSQISHSLTALRLFDEKANFSIDAGDIIWTGMYPSFPTIITPVMLGLLPLSPTSYSGVLKWVKFRKARDMCLQRANREIAGEQGSAETAVILDRLGNSLRDGTYRVRDFVR